MADRYPFLSSAHLSTNDLDAIYATLTRTQLRGKGSATRAKALARVTKQLDFDCETNDLESILEVLPALVKNQGFYRQGEHLAAALAEQDGPAAETEETVVTERDDTIETLDETPGTTEPVVIEGEAEAVEIEDEAEAEAETETDLDGDAESEAEPAPGFVTEEGATEAEAEAGADPAKEAALDAFRSATEAFNAAKEALRTAKARYDKARAAARPFLKGRAKRGHKAGTGALPREGSADHVLLGLLERDEGVTQAQLKAVLPKYNSVAYHSERLAAKLGRTVTVEGEGKARVFRFAKA